jgi:cobalt-zinc-cadmium efflux system protein
MKRCTPTVILLITLVTNGGFTCAQSVAALLSHSLALLSDSAQMACDTAMYGLNLGVEVVKARAASSATQDAMALRRAAVCTDIFELVATAVSAGALLAVCTYSFIEATDRLAAAGAGEPTVEVIPLYVVVFSSINLLVDALQGTLFCVELVRAVRRRKLNVNVCSAGAHVVADTLRTIAEMVSSSLAAAGLVDASFADAIAAIAVNALVMVGAVALCVSIASLALRVCREARAIARGEARVDDSALLANADGADRGAMLDAFLVDGGAGAELFAEQGAVCSNGDDEDDGDVL